MHMEYGPFICCRLFVCNRALLDLEFRVISSFHQGRSEIKSDRLYPSTRHLPLRSS